MSAASPQLMAANCVSDGPTVSHAHALILTPRAFVGGVARAARAAAVRELDRTVHLCEVRYAWGAFKRERGSGGT